MEEIIITAATYVRMIREVKPDCVGDAPAKPPGESAGRRGGMAVVVADDTAASSLSRSFCLWEGTGEERRPTTAGNGATGPLDRESTTESNSSCFCWMARSWLITSSRVVPGGKLLDAMVTIEAAHTRSSLGCLNPVIDRFTGHWNRREARQRNVVNTMKLTETKHGVAL